MTEDRHPATDDHPGLDAEFAEQHPSGADAAVEADSASAGSDDTEEPESPSGRRVILWVLLVLVAGAAIASLAIRMKPEPERQEPATTAPLVQVVAAEIGPVHLDVPSQGTVEPTTASTLVAQVAGRVTRVAEGFAEGGYFRRGETLVQIDPRDYRLAVTDAEAARAQARVALEREQAEAELARQEWEELGRGGEASALLLRKPQLAQAEATVAAAEAAVERARLALSRTRVTAPFDGRVRAKRADVGQFVAAGSPLADLYATSSAEVRLPVARDDLAYLDVGVGWSANGEAGPPVALTGELAGRRHTWRGRVVRTGAEIDPRSRMLGVFARIDDPLRRDGTGADIAGPPLPMGLFVEASIEGRTVPSAAVLPRRALLGTPRGGDAQVMVVDDEGRLTFRTLEVLRTDGDEVIVGSGLSDGERVVVSRLDEAVDGMTVRTTLAEWSPDPSHSVSPGDDHPAHRGSPQAAPGGGL